MYESTIIAEELQQNRDKTRHDTSCKKILSNKYILAYVLKGCLKEFQDCDIKDIAEKYIEGIPKISEMPVHESQKEGRNDETPRVREKVLGLGNELVSNTEGKVTFDLFFRVIIPGTGRRLQMFVNLEAQQAYYPGYPLTKRGTYYEGRMISWQRGSVFTGSEYQKLKKICSIWICMDPPHERKNAMNRYTVQEEHLAGWVEETEENYDLTTMVMIYLGDYKSTKNELLELLDVLFYERMDHREKQRILRERFQIPMTKEVEEAMSALGIPEADRTRYMELLEV